MLIISTPVQILVVSSVISFSDDAALSALETKRKKRK